MTERKILRGIVTDINQKAITVTDIETKELTVIQYQEFAGVDAEEIVYLSPYNHPNIYKGAVVEYIQNTAGAVTESSQLPIGALAGETLWTPEIEPDLDEITSTIYVVLDRVIPITEEKDGEEITLYEGFATGIPSFLNYRFRAGKKEARPGDVWSAKVYKKDKRGAKCTLISKCN